MSERLGRVEKENKELKEEVHKRSTVADYDLQARCARDAKTWFNDNWERDNTTILLDYTNHYNKSMNKCFILVEFHYSTGADGSWTNNMTIWDVHENSKYGKYSEHHSIYFKPKPPLQPPPSICELLDTKCKSLQQFNNLVGPYMNN